MTSKEALDILMFAWLGRRDDKDYPDFDDIHNALYYIEQYLDRLEKLEKVVEILKGRICVHNQYVCYDMYADIPLKDNEIELLKEVLGND